MDHTDFADHSNHHLSSPLSERVDSPRLSQNENYIVHNIEHEYEDDEHEASGHNSSGQDEAVFDEAGDITRQSSPHTSNHSEDDISLLPEESRAPSCASEHRYSSTPYTPIKTRSPFRNPSSVRAIQLETTPPYLMLSSQKQRYKLETSSRNSTPGSMRSHCSAMHSPLKPSSPKKVVKEHPLVLLHVTLLPIPLPYSQEIMESVLPSHIIESWKLLQEKATDTLLERGILVPHPKEDYDLLEERLLESLELQIPRILKCGHFRLDPEDADGIGASESDYDSDEDADICEDCGRRIRDGTYGSGTGRKRWDIKIYAANGLMRAGAWGAAWREMERVDVEIMPWIEDKLRREMDLRRHEDSASAAPSENTEPDRTRAMDNERMREIYGEDPQTFIDGFADQEKVSRQPTARRKQASAQHDLPFPTLLLNYLQLVLQDRRNIAIILLSVVVLFLAMGSRSLPQPILQQVPTEHVAPPIATIVSTEMETVMAAPTSVSSVLLDTPARSVSTPVESAMTQLAEVEKIL